MLSLVLPYHTLGRPGSRARKLILANSTHSKAEAPLRDKAEANWSLTSLWSFRDSHIQFVDGHEMVHCHPQGSSIT